MIRLLILSLLMTTCTLQAVAQISNYHVIQVGTFIDADYNDFSALRSLGLVHANSLGGNLMEVFLGGFKDRNTAEATLKEVQREGYPNAFIQNRPVIDGQYSTVIQLATRNISKPVNWEEFNKLGDLLAILDNKTIKIVTGPFASSREAQAALASIRRQGFSDAFVKSVNVTYLHPLTPFETGTKQELIPMEFDYTGSKGQATTTSSQPAPAESDGEYTILQPQNTAAATPPYEPGLDIPGGYDYTPSAVAGNPPPAYNYTAKASLPAIDGKLKRTSALELQKILKAKGAYAGGLDGYYGNGTAEGYNTFASENRLMRKYAMLAEFAPLPGQAGNNSALQQLINELPNQPNGPSQLRNFSEPVAKAYIAYTQFINFGPSYEVNQLMINANRAAFAGKNVNNLPFDPNATYAYQDLGQLILHLHYIHSADPSQTGVPCWMAQRHPQEVSRAMQASTAMVGKGLKLQSCGQFESWPEVRMLVMIASDLNTDEPFNQDRLGQAASERSRLYLAPKALNSTEQKAVKRWSKNLVNGLNSWGARDPMHQQMVTTFRVLFFQSQVRLEDYFMDKGYKKEEAEGLALAALHTLVAYHTQRFV
jgi:hypothetical protein